MAYLRNSVFKQPENIMIEPAEKQETLIIAVGSLLALDYNASIGEFAKIAAEEGKTLKLTPEIFASIFKIDDEFKQGIMKEDEFRSHINSVLEINPSPEKFDHAWNAMLGDTQRLDDQLKKIHTLPANFIFISSTNPIHTKKLGVDKWQKYQVYLSYEHNCSDVECYKKMFSEEQLDPHKTIIVLREIASNVKDIREKNNLRADMLMQWAQSMEIKICESDSKDDITTTLKTYLETQSEKQSLRGFKNA